MKQQITEITMNKKQILEDIEMLGASQNVIKKKLHKFEIPLPTVSSSNKGLLNKRGDDWEKKDEEILEKIRAAEKEINRFGDSRPVKISVATFGEMIHEKYHMQRNLDRMPKTKEYIQHLLDDKESYDI